MCWDVLILRLENINKNFISYREMKLVFLIAGCTIEKERMPVNCNCR